MSGLFGSTILEVVLGLSFVYILLSLLCSSINELLAGFLKLRAKDLDSGIRNLLADPDLAREVLDHPLIKALGSTRSETIAVQVGAGGAPTTGKNPLRRLWHRMTGSRRDFAGKPSYIPSRMFSIALFDTITPPTGRAITVGDLQRAAAALGGLNLDAPDPEKESKQVADLTPQESIGRALLSLINESRDPGQLRLTLDAAKELVNRLSDVSLDDAAKASLNAVGTLDELRRRIEELPDIAVRQRLLDAIAEGQAGLNRARQSVELWFDDAMERASGIYKRRTQWWLLVIATVVTLALGVDTFRIYNSLATNPGLRTALVAQIEQSSEGGGILETPTPTAAADAAGTPTANNEPAQPAPSPQGVFDELERTNLPFGYADWPGFTAEAEDAGDWTRWIIARFFGLLLTTFAVALGAPFWFDVLNRVSNIRAAGKPPAPTSAAAPPPSRSS